MNLLLDLFFTFLKIGFFTFGGGYAMLSIIENMCVEKKKWISHDEMMQITVIAESTPGPIAINCATFVGYKRKGFWGAVASTLGVILPSFFVIYLIARLLDHFFEYPIVTHAFQGIKLAVGILIIDASLKMLRKMQKNVLTYTILICAAVIMLITEIFSKNFSSISLILLAGACSLIVFVVKQSLRKDSSKSNTSRKAGKRNDSM